MLKTLLEWMGAGDAAIASMGPMMSIALAWLGSFGITQTLKFPLCRVLPQEWSAWIIRLVAMISCWLCAHYIGELPNMVELVVAVSQPLAYKVAMSLVRHWWPWLEAGKVLGSAAPSQAAQDAMAQRKGGQ